MKCHSYANDLFWLKYIVPCGVGKRRNIRDISYLVLLQETKQNEYERPKSMSVKLHTIKKEPHAFGYKIIIKDDKN